MTKVLPLVCASRFLGSHMEFGENPSPADSINQSVFGKVSWRL